MLGIYNYTVILTYIGMLTGFCGIVSTLDGNIRGAVVCLVLAGVCDMFDGKIASTMTRTRQEKRFGVQIDSLSDLICFGVLPALIVYQSYHGALRLIPSALYLLCALIRLAWFNVDEEERQDQEGGRRKEYLGLPVTCSALIFPVLMGMGIRFHWPMEILTPWILIGTAAAFLTPFRLKKPAMPRRNGMSFHGAREIDDMDEVPGCK